MTTCARCILSYESVLFVEATGSSIGGKNLCANFIESVVLGRAENKIEQLAR